MKLSDFSEVARLVPEKNFCEQHNLVDMQCESCQKRWFGNQAIDSLTPLLSLEVTSNVGKLVGIITQTITKYEGHVDWQKRCSPLQLAQAIASSNVIEIKNEYVREEIGYICSPIKENK